MILYQNKTCFPYKKAGPNIMYEKLVIGYS